MSKPIFVSIIFLCTFPKSLLPAMHPELLANINQQDARGHTALALAAYNGDKESVLLLLQCKADMEIPNLIGCTPLHLVIDTPKKTTTDAIVRTLVIAGANIDHEDNNMQTAWDKASPEIKQIIARSLKKRARILAEQLLPLEIEHPESDLVLLQTIPLSPIRAQPLTPTDNISPLRALKKAAQVTAIPRILKYAEEKEADQKYVHVSDEGDDWEIL